MSSGGKISPWGAGEVTLIRGKKKGKFPHGHPLFIDDEIPAMIDPADRPDLLAEIQRERPVKVVLNSHYHVDHIRYNHLFPDAQAMAHPKDAPGIESLDEMARLVGIDSMPFVDIWKSGMRDYFGYRESEVSNLIDDGDLVELGKNTVKVLHTPGHTGGHCCFQLLEKKAVYLADIDLTGFGPWYGNVSSDIDDFIRSIEMLKNLEVEVYYSAHGRGIYSGNITDVFDRYLAVIYRREERILEFLREEMELEEVVEQLFIYGKKWEPEPMCYFIEGVMVKKHLLRLERLGMVTQAKGKWRSVT